MTTPDEAAALPLRGHLSWREIDIPQTLMGQFLNMFTRVFRHLIAKAGIAVMLFAQLAVAVYACPGLTGQVESAPASMASDQHVAMNGGSEELDANNPNTCRQHCQAGNQSVERASSANALPVAMVPLTIVEVVRPASTLGVTILPVLLERETAPPPSIRFSVFRI